MIRYSANITIMMSAARKASKKIIRDFGELEKLQVSSKSLGDFVTNTDIYAEKSIIETLSYHYPEYNFKGLKDGDRWCICATWFARAIDEGKACSVFLKKTNVKTLELIPLEKLKKFAVDLS